MMSIIGVFFIIASSNNSRWICPQGDTGEVDLDNTHRSVRGLTRGVNHDAFCEEYVDGNRGYQEELSVSLSVL